MRQNLKAFVRVDASNRIVPGSLVLRKHQPGSVKTVTNGRWMEINPYLCCNFTPGPTPQTVAIPTLTGANSYTVTIASGGITVGPTNTGVTTPAALVSYLNSNYASVGSFTLSGTNVIFTPTVAGATLTLGQGLNGVNVALPTLSGGSPNYHITLANGAMTTGDVNTSTTTGAALVTYLTTNYGTLGTYTLNGTNVLFKAAASGTTLTIVAGA